MTKPVLTQNEKRRIQRIRLDSPVIAHIDTLRVHVVDLSTTGARLEHEFSVPVGKNLRLSLDCDGENVQIDSVVLRCKLQRSHFKEGIAYTSGIEFSEGNAEALKALRRLITNMVVRDIEERKAYLRFAQH